MRFKLELAYQHIKNDEILNKAIKRNLFGLYKEENRIYEALIAKITLCMFAYNIVSYINPIKHEPQTLGELFRDLECELVSLAFYAAIYKNTHKNLRNTKCYQGE